MALKWIKTKETGVRYREHPTRRHSGKPDRYFTIRLKEELNRAKRNKTKVSLLILDIDHFKNYNDHYGHIYGDQCLAKIATAIQSLFQRSGELVARYGGEEFAVILPHTDCETATKMGEAILDKEQLGTPDRTSVVISYGLRSIGWQS